MPLMLSRILSHSNCILMLVIFNLVSSAPLKSSRNSPLQNDQGFSASPKILEIQLPLKIASKEDLIAWSKYVTGLMASKINFASISKNSPSVEKRFPFTSNSDSRSKETMKKAPLNEKRPGLNYPARRLKEPPVQNAEEKVVAYPLPMGAMQTTASNPQDPSSLSSSNVNGPNNFGQYVDFNIGNPFQNEIDPFANFEAYLQPPANMYLPLPQIDIPKSYQNAIDKNVSSFEEPAKFQTTSNSLNFHINAHNNELQQALPFTVNNGLNGINLSHVGEPLLTFPFQALITVTKELPLAAVTSKIQQKDYIASRDFPNEFLPYFENNYTNESGQIVFNDFAADTSETKTKGKVKKGNEKVQNTQGQKKQNQKKTSKTSSKKQKSSVKRQSSILGDLLRMLGVLRKLPKNSTEINVATPVLSILKGNSQKIQVAFDETPPNRGRSNETFQAQQLDEDDDENDDNGNGDNGNGDNGNGDNGNGDNENDDNENEAEGNGDDDDGPQTESQEDDEEEEGGSIQAIIDLLPLAAPILEELSDPESDVDIAEVLQGAIPLLEGLSDPEEDGVDLPSVLLPLSQKLSEGPEGQGSDSGAILGPIIQLIAPLIGPLSGPLIGPLSRTSSGPQGAQGSASASATSSEPLSKPQGAYGQSILSGLIASITAKLSKESVASADESDVKSLVSSVVSGVLAGASAGSSGHKKGYGYNRYGPYGQNASNGYGQYNRDTYHASTSHGDYHPYGYDKPRGAPSSGLEALAAPLQEVLGAFLKLSSTSSSSSANLSGASSSSSTSLSAGSSQSSHPTTTAKPTYGPPPKPPHYASHHYYAAPPAPPSSYNSYAPASTSSAYTSYARRQVARQKKKF
ncbi:PREDICTED: uncharacterized protein LOC105457605 [Wasmannia auropunctata]|uniref:uncharacterized protein LOC105457605 n=1 Tax=Wasmannia auropunctata TaxID=64793 RepID=UPI0005EE1273|nr:PREDICTED: uncharacterized protein LOC105457605 [Wasmannia auropunctata]